MRTPSFGRPKQSRAFELSRDTYKFEAPKRPDANYVSLLWVSYSKWAINPETEAEFIALQEKLLDETAGTSHFRDILLNQNYRWMISLNDPLIPIILREIVIDPSPVWVTLLRDVARFDPVPIEERSDYLKVVERWREWGLEQGFLRDNRNSSIEAQAWLEAVSSSN